MNAANSILAAVLLTGAFSAAEIPKEIPLWPKGAPGSEGKTAPEKIEKSDSGELRVSSIHNPSITPYLPETGEGDRGGGPGHSRWWPSVARDHARGLQRRRVAGRARHRGVRPEAPSRARRADSTYRIEVESFADAQRAMRLVRSRAAGVEDRSGSPWRAGVLRRRRTRGA